MVVPQNLGVQLAARLEQCLPHPSAIAGAISVVPEAGKTIVATPHDVLRHAWQIESRLAGHVHSIAAKMATQCGHSAVDDVKVQRAGLWEVNLTPFQSGAVTTTKIAYTPASAIRSEAV